MVVVVVLKAVQVFEEKRQSRSKHFGHSKTIAIIKNSMDSESKQLIPSTCCDDAKVDVPFIPDDRDCLRMLETSNQKDYNVFERFFEPRRFKDCKFGLKE